MIDVADPDFQTQLIINSWSAFAPFAYSRYLQRGRGGILLKLSTLELYELEGDQLEVEGDGLYVTVHDMPLPKKVADAVAAYDPQLQIVVVIDNGKDFYTYRGAPKNLPSPKELYERQFN